MKTTAEKIAIMQAYERGEKIEAREIGQRTAWFPTEAPKWGWTDYEYRIAKKPAFPVTISAPVLKPGEKFVGVILSADGNRRHALILLPGEIEDANWKQANAWAAGIGGELPDRVEGALLFATLKDEFKPEWYWTREQHAVNDDFAWCQSFNNGLQNLNRKLNQLRARAIRRFFIR